MTPRRGNPILIRSSQQLSYLRLGPLKGLFSCALQGPSTRLAPATIDKQGTHQVCLARRGGPRTPSITTNANLDCAFVENVLFKTNS